MNLCRGILYKSVFILITSSLLSACGDSETPAEKSGVAVKQTESAGTALPDTATAPAMQKQQTTPEVLENGVIYQEEIYKNWPYTEAPQEMTEPTPTGMIEEKIETVKAMAEEKMEAVETVIKEQVAPVVEAVTVTPVAKTAVTETQVATATVDGGQIYNTYCAICHKGGMNAAPKYGSKPLWAKRIAQGRDTVYSHAINGLRGMPARGGFASLSDDEVRAGTDYMVRAAGGWGDK